MKTEIKQYFKEVAQRRPDAVYPRLKQGDLVNAGAFLNTLFYEIDNPEIYRRLIEEDCSTEDCKLTNVYEKVYEAFPHSDKKKLFETGKLTEKKIVPFSRVFELGIGNCLEKAIAVQLWKQNKGTSFLVNGWIEVNGEYGLHPHSFNVIFEDGIPYLVDVNNPIKDKSTGQRIPYIAPIIGIDSRVFQVPEEWEKGRKYSHSDHL